MLSRDGNRYQREGVTAYYQCSVVHLYVTCVHSMLERFWKCVDENWVGTHKSKVSSYQINFDKFSCENLYITAIN